jgi:hypothetical protein
MQCTCSFLEVIKREKFVQVPVVNNKTSYADEIICVDFDATSQIMIIYSTLVKYLEH